jgi:hypothetical protein
MGRGRKGKPGADIHQIAIGIHQIAIGIHQIAIGKN